MSKISYYNKSGKKIPRKDFIKMQKNLLVGGDALKVSMIKKEKTLITKKDLEKMQNEGLIEIKKFKGKDYLNEKELLYALKVQERQRKIATPKQEGLF